VPTFSRISPATASALLFVAFATAAAALGAPDISPKHVRGTIASVSASSITVTTDGGPVVVALSKSSGVLGVVRGNAADIKTGTFVGIANVSGHGAMRALEVVVFPDAMRGAGEGNYPWDLPAGGGHSSMMTNGTVSAGGGHGSMMTNGTVASGAAGQPITLTYKGGSQRIAIPPDVPIVRIAPGTRALLVPGAHVVVFTISGPGPLNAARIVAGVHGVVPPM
jgi:hypothetical protein